MRTLRSWKYLPSNVVSSCVHRLRRICIDSSVRRPRVFGSTPQAHHSFGSSPPTPTPRISRPPRHAVDHRRLQRDRRRVAQRQQVHARLQFELRASRRRSSPASSDRRCRSRRRSRGRRRRRRRRLLLRRCAPTPGAGSRAPAAATATSVRPPPGMNTFGICNVMAPPRDKRMSAAALAQAGAHHHVCDDVTESQHALHGAGCKVRAVTTT